MRECSLACAGREAARRELSRPAKVCESAQGGSISLIGISLWAPNPSFILSPLLLPCPVLKFFVCARTFVYITRLKIH